MEIPWESRRCDTLPPDTLSFLAAFLAIAFTWLVKVKELFTSTPSMEIEVCRGSDLPSSRIVGIEVPVEQCLRETSIACVFSGARSTCHRRPHKTMVCRIWLGNMLDSRAMITTVAGECQGAVFGVCMSLWNELEQVIKEYIPEERAEDTSLWYTGRDGMVF